MNFLRKYPIAILLSCLLIVLSVVLGQVKHMENTGQLPGGQTTSPLPSALDRTLSTASMEPFIMDEDNLLSSNTKEQISLYNANLYAKYQSVVAVLVLPSLKGDIADAAYNEMKSAGLSTNDALLLLTLDNREAYLALGDTFFPHWGNPDIRDFVESTLYPEYRQGNDTEGLRNFFSSLYAEFARSTALPQVQTSVSGSVNILTLFPALFFLCLVLFICTIVDNTSYTRYYRQYGGMMHPPIVFRPVLFWHGPGSHWFMRRQQKKPAEDTRNDKPNDGGFSGFSGGFGGFGSSKKGGSR